MKHDRQFKNIRKDVSVDTVVIWYGKQISKIATLCARSTYRKYRTRNFDQYHSSKWGTGETKNIKNNIYSFRLVAYTYSFIKRFAIHQYQTIYVRRRAYQRNRQNARRLDTSFLEEGSCLNTVVGFIRGGNWNNGANSGLFTLNLNNAPSNVNTNIGFRCARYIYNYVVRIDIFKEYHPCQKFTDMIRLVDDCKKISNPYLYLTYDGLLTSFLEKPVGSQMSIL